MLLDQQSSLQLLKNQEIELKMGRIGYFVVLAISSIIFTSTLILVDFKSNFVVFSYIVGLTIGLGFIILMNLTEELTSRLKVFVLTFFLIIFVFVAAFFNIFTFEILIGLIPSIPLIFLRLFPYNIIFKVCEYSDYYILEKTLDNIFVKSRLNRKLAYSTEIGVQTPPVGWRSFFATSSSFIIISFNDIKDKHEPIEFAPASIKGLNLLDKLVQLFPGGTRLTANVLDRPTGGLLSSLEPKIHSVDYRINKQSSNEAVRRLNNLKLEGSKILVPSKISLVIDII